VRAMATRHDVPIVSDAESPIWFVRAGGVRNAMDLATRMKDDGYYVNISTYPAVAPKHSGVRFTNTLYHSQMDIEGLMRAMGDNLRIVRSGPDEVDLRATG